MLQPQPSEQQQQTRAPIQPEEYFRCPVMSITMKVKRCDRAAGTKLRQSSCKTCTCWEDHVRVLLNKEEVEGPANEYLKSHPMPTDEEMAAEKKRNMLDQRYRFKGHSHSRAIK